ncbi:MAG TPA: hypothetical protein VHU61_14765 [Solirubrobacteraceae bacterium]|nr:hypothetical protein [Solirubrobacteraceae bacterium]
MTGLLSFAIRYAFYLGTHVPTCVWALLVGACVLPLRPGRVVHLLSSKALAAVGIASYSIYLWHVPIETWMHRRHYAFVHHFGEMALIAIPICLAAGFLSYRLIEAPFLSLRKRWGPAV